MFALERPAGAARHAACGDRLGAPMLGTDHDQVEHHDDRRDAASANRRKHHAADAMRYAGQEEPDVCAFSTAR